jgi:mannose-6-phosphate isomerase
MNRPYRLNRSFREKIWGSTDLSPLFGPQCSRIGEVWFTADQPLRLLVKFIFTSDKLSVQVHPDDAYARLHENGCGKTEMWYILRADPGAKIALGFRELVTREQVRAAARSGKIEELLNWIPVAPGDTYLTPAGTVHAIGAGIALCEIQQNSDITYRLYDYGRPRELHLERALDVAILGPHPGKSEPNGNLLVDCPHFRTELVQISSHRTFGPDSAVLTVLEGSGMFGDDPIEAGQVWHIPNSSIICDIKSQVSIKLLYSHIKLPITSIM